MHSSPLAGRQSTGKVRYLTTGEESGWRSNRCQPQPRHDLLHNRNPTCDLRTYVGGQSVCHHGWHLLDADQEIPWQDQPLEYYKKFRVYFTEYNASHHVQITRRDWGIGAGGNHDEYDVPQCPPGTPTAQCRHIGRALCSHFPFAPSVHTLRAHLVFTLVQAHRARDVDAGARL